MSAPPEALASPHRRVRPRTILMIVASAMFMEQLDGTVLATALPTMARSFHADPLHMNVALTSYLLTLAMFIPASGRIADRFGSKSVFRAAIGLFTLGSICCAQAPTLWALVAARMLQGAGGAMMSPVGRLVMLRVVSKAELVQSMAWLMIPATIGPIVGPPLGGFIVTYLSWHWIFYVNVPIGILGIVLVTIFIDEMKEPVRTKFDLRGLFLSGTALACLMFGIEVASRGVGSGWIIAALLGAGAASAGLYTVHARRTERPMLDFRLLRITTFRMSLLCGSLSRIAVGAMPFLLPMMFQLGFGMSAAESGSVTFVGSIGSLAMRACAPAFLRWLGFRTVLTWVGALATGLLAASAAFRPDWPLPLIYAVLLANGFFQSLQFMAYNTIAYADVTGEDMSAATSFYTTFQQMALTLGIAVSAAALAASIAATGHAQPMLPDFSAAFLFVAAVSFLAPLLATRLDKGAGAELSGHRERPGRAKIV
ncbi:MFS transporter [Rhodopila globiformis]|uniref:MFS transporter n=1 Tax=Rhodopila globiformis TaxID=1071 RepID=A0A2S6N122_RHOGL|nr:MFS transporter [Rhodopila globiformis]PPQ28321.1 MFS transporter [Rhodopila globiformis]